MKNHFTLKSLKTEKSSWHKWFMAIATILLLNVSLPFTGYTQQDINYLPPGCEAPPTKNGEKIFYDMYFDADITKSGNDIIDYNINGKNFPELKVNDIIIHGDYRSGFQGYRIDDVSYDDNGKLIIKKHTIHPTELEPNLDTKFKMTDNFVYTVVEYHDGRIERQTSDERYYNKNKNKYSDLEFIEVSDWLFGDLDGHDPTDTTNIDEDFETDLNDYEIPVLDTSNIKIIDEIFDGNKHVKITADLIRLAYDPYVEFGWDGEYESGQTLPTIKGAHLKVTGNLYAKVLATANVTYTGGKTFKKELFKKTSYKTVGVLLVIANFQVNAEAEVYAGIDGTVKCGGEVNVYHKLGAEYVNDKWNPICSLDSITYGLYNEDPASEHGKPTFDVNGLGVAEVRVRPLVYAMVWGVVGAELTVFPYVTFDVKSNNAPPDALLYCGHKAQVKFDFGYVNCIWDLKWTHNLYNKKHFLWANYPWTPSDMSDDVYAGEENKILVTPALLHHGNPNAGKKIYHFYCGSENGFLTVPWVKFKLQGFEDGTSISVYSYLLDRDMANSEDKNKLEHKYTTINNEGYWATAKDQVTGLIPNMTFTVGPDRINPYVNTDYIHVRPLLRDKGQRHGKIMFVDNTYLAKKASKQEEYTYHKGEYVKKTDISYPSVPDNIKKDSIVKSNPKLLCAETDNAGPAPKGTTPKGDVVMCKDAGWFCGMNSGSCFLYTIDEVNYFKKGWTYDYSNSEYWNAGSGPVLATFAYNYGCHSNMNFDCKFYKPNGELYCTESQNYHCNDPGYWGYVAPGIYIYNADWFPEGEWKLEYCVDGDVIKTHYFNVYNADNNGELSFIDPTPAQGVTISTWNQDVKDGQYIITAASDGYLGGTDKAKYYINGTSYEDIDIHYSIATSGWNIANAPDGEYTVQVKIHSDLGWKSTEERTFTIDNTLPSYCHITSPTDDNIATKPYVTVTVDVPDDIAKVEYYIVTNEQPYPKLVGYSETAPFSKEICVLAANNNGDAYADTVKLQAIAYDVAGNNIIDEQILTLRTANLIPDGIAKYPMSEGSGTTIFDASGAGNTGTIHGATWTTGKIGGALSFDGSSTVNIPDANSLDITNAITVEAWILLNEYPSNYQDFLNKEEYNTANGGTQNGFILRGNANGKPFFFVGNKKNGVGGAKTLHSTVAIPLHTFTHVVGTYDGSFVKIYIDGNLNNTTAYTGGIGTNNKILTLAGLRGVPHGKCVMDEVAIYDRALTADEISDNYKAGTLVAKYTMDNITGTTLFDETVNYNDGTIKGATVVAGKIGNALNFDGSSTVNIPDANSLDMTDAITVEAWILLNEYPSNYQDFLNKEEYSTANGGTQNGFILRGNANGKPFFFVGNKKDGVGSAITLHSTVAIPLHTFTHVVGTYDGNFVKIYIDGNLSNTTAYTGGIGTNNKILTLAGLRGVPHGKCIMDEVAIYNRALTADEISDNYKSGAIVAQYHMSEGDGSTITLDATLNNNDGTINGATWTDGKIDKGLSFDGNNDYVDCGNDESLQITDEITVSFWVNPTSYPTDEYTNILRKERAYLSMIRTNGKATMHIFIEGNTWRSVESIDVIPLSQWSHITGTYDGQAIKIYINGVFSNEVSQTGAISIGTEALAIGHDRRQRWGHGLTGKIDEVTIYDRALTAAEIAEHAGVTPESNAVAQLHMDEESGTIAYDATPNNNNGTLVNGATWTTDCAAGSHALSFDGSNDYVDCGNDASLNITKNLTIEAWIKPNGLSGAGGIISKLTGTADKQYGLNTDGDEIYFQYERSSNNYYLSGGTLTNDTWQHIAATVDNSLNICLYLDGKLIASDVAPAETSPTTESVIIGKWGGTYDNYFFDGKIDEVVIYDRALTAAEIAEHADVGSKGTENTGGEETVTEIQKVEQTEHLLVYPNPMSNELSIEYNVQSAGMVTIGIYDITGHLVKTLKNGYALPGGHIVQWNADNTNGTEMPNGTYFIRMQTNNNTQTTKVILIR